MTKVSFANRLLDAMQSRGVNQSQLAERTKISKSMISEYLQGKYLPKQDKVFKIASSLDVSESWLMGYEVDMNPNRYLNDKTKIDLYLFNEICEALIDNHNRDVSLLPIYSTILSKIGMLNERGLTKVLQYIRDISESDDNIRDNF